MAHHSAFNTLVNRLAHRKHPKVKKPKALAAFIGRRKYGKAKFERMSLAGRLHHRIRGSR